MFLISIRTTVADDFAAASVNHRFTLISWQRQEANLTLSIMVADRLSEQLIISNFSHPFLAFLLVLWPMIFLTLDAAIFHEVASTFLEFDVVQCSFATRSTHFVSRRF
jgi:hypothetical protein